MPAIFFLEASVDSVGAWVLADMRQEGGGRGFFFSHRCMFIDTLVYSGFFFVKAVAVESRNSIPVSRMPFFIYVCGWGGLGWMELGKGGAKEE